MSGVRAKLAFAGMFGGILYGAIAINFLMERWQIRARWPEEEQEAEPIRRARRQGPGRWFATPARTQERFPVSAPPAFEPSSLARDGIALNRAFASIADPKLRADVIAHVEAMARYDRRITERGG